MSARPVAAAWPESIAPHAIKLLRPARNEIIDRRWTWASEIRQHPSVVVCRMLLMVVGRESGSSPAITIVEGLVMHDGMLNALPFSTQGQLVPTTNAYKGFVELAHMNLSPHRTPRAAPGLRGISSAWAHDDASARLAPTHVGRALLAERPLCTATISGPSSLDAQSGKSLSSLVVTVPV
jgi:hypothetical protein